MTADETAERLRDAVKTAGDRFQALAASIGLPVESLATIEHLDEDWAIPCERVQRSSVSLDEGRSWQPGGDHCGGQNPAEWVMHSACACEPRLLLYCTPCRDLVLSLPRVGCAGCGRIWSPASKSFRLIEPLNRRTK